MSRLNAYHTFGEQRDHSHFVLSPNFRPYSTTFVALVLLLFCVWCCFVAVEPHFEEVAIHLPIGNTHF